MKLLDVSAIDCDVHPTVPDLADLLPYMEPHWRDTISDRGIEAFESISYPPNAPLSARPDWRDERGRAAQNVTSLATQALDRWNLRFAVGNCIYGVHMAFSEDLAAVLARAVNDWLVREWLDREPRLRASIVVPLQNPELAVDEIRRRSEDRRFVQVLLPAMAEAPLGRRHFWPIYSAAERAGLPIGIHAGSSYRHPVTPVGWPSHYVEDYASQAQAFQGQLASLVCEGVFTKFPNLKVVLIESGVTWLTPFLWRLTKFWRGLRSEVPWVDRPPSEIVREHVRMTIQPFDAPDGTERLERIIDHLQSDRMLLFSSDFPHWQFDGDEVLPNGFPESLVGRIAVDNPLETYPRMKECMP
ncbi:amidohydrolase family protein [Arenibaculum pallidiluteum]|uniref:amidohydrolase family protein n=1 Tax=Arenibaculum pallidiluteum TaxID=2812559 RepID=UPI001A957801|nr:amidohydrolase family protein [Arenibaculum pallidiluteum]